MHPCHTSLSITNFEGAIDVTHDRTLGLRAAVGEVDETILTRRAITTKWIPLKFMFAETRRGERGLRVLYRWQAGFFCGLVLDRLVARSLFATHAVHMGDC